MKLAVRWWNNFLTMHIELADENRNTILDRRNCVHCPKFIVGDFLSIRRGSRIASNLAITQDFEQRRTHFPQCLLFPLATSREHYTSINKEFKTVYQNLFRRSVRDIDANQYAMSRVFPTDNAFYFCHCKRLGQYLPFGIQESIVDLNV